MKLYVFLILMSLLWSCRGDEKWKALFNEDLSNATDKEDAWYFENNILRSTKDACIFTSTEFENFELDLEFKNEVGTNSGVIVYCTNKDDWIPNSVEIQIADDYYFEDKDWVPNYMCGGIFGHQPPSSTLVKEAGEWNHLNIVCAGQKIRVILNGEISAEINMADWTSGTINPDGSEIPSWLPTPLAELPTRGYIGLQGKHGEANISFRNISVRSLKHVLEY